MRLPAHEASIACGSRPRPPFSVGPVYQRAGGVVAVAGALAVVEGPVAPRPFWDLVRWLSTRCEWLRGTFAVTTRPSCYGLVRADGEAPVVQFRGTWRGAPRLTLVAAGKHVDVRAVERAVRPCIVAAGIFMDEDPFSTLAVGDSCGPVLDEEAIPHPKSR